MKRILIVDEQKDVANTLVLFLKTIKDLEPMAAFSSSEACLMIEKHKPQILLVDLKLEEESGFAITECAKKTLPKAAIVVITCYNYESVKRKFKSLDVDYFLPKPFKLEDLQTLIEKIIKENLQQQF